MYDCPVINFLAQFGPGIEIKSLILLVDRLCDALVQKRECAPDTGYIYWLIVTVENQNIGAKDIHLSVVYSINPLAGAARVISY